MLSPAVANELIGAIVHVECLDIAAYCEQVKRSELGLITLHVYGFVCQATPEYIAIAQQLNADQVRMVMCIPLELVRFIERAVVMHETADGPVERTPIG